MIPPYKKIKPKCCIVGMATTSRDQAPWHDEDYEFWILNESCHGRHKDRQGKTFVKNLTRLFQMHPRWDYMRGNNFNQMTYPQWLRNDPWTDEERKANEEKPDNHEITSWGATPEQRRRTDFPIYMLEVDEEIPGSVLYPIENILESYDYNRNVAKWFTNSFAYMMALAIHLEFEAINFVGFEMSSETEYGHQRPCAAFWAGVAMGRGIEIIEPKGGRLLGQHDVLYGYDKIPGITLMHLEIERNHWNTELAKSQAKLEQIKGQIEHLQGQIVAAKNQRGRQRKLMGERNNLINEEFRALIAMNSISSAKQIVEKHIKDLKGLPRTDDITLIPMRRVEMWEE